VNQGDSNMKRLVIALAASTVAFTAPGGSAKGKSESKISKEQAQETAVKAVPGQLLGWSEEIEAGAPEYEFKIKTTSGSVRVVEVNGKTGELGKDKKIEIEKSGAGVERKTTNSEDLELWKKAKINRIAAERTALGKVRGSTEQWESNYDNGNLEYKFLVSTNKGKKAVEIDAITGKVLEVNEYKGGSNL